MNLSTPNPLRPYLATIRGVGYCLLAGAVLIGGCKMGQHMERADADSKVAAAGKERDKASKVAADYLAAANACGQLVAGISQETALAKQRSDEWKKAAEIADARASKAADDAAAKVAAAEKALQAAKAKPVCRSQLALELCPEIPLL
ncbi:hypothetical protein HEP73_02158 [Xanthomonas sp. GW]|uniref:hypothetical protein n=1 Tax=Xanthomonas sp. GW TaxID=2724121 RepID=UPI0016398072|nr:hypothetical protein [Xanthomonas sp. GW]QNH21244.1 hypothetical protein HEP73_02158 [Xanthomonas sp. GW]